MVGAVFNLHISVIGASFASIRFGVVAAIVFSLVMFTEVIQAASSQTESPRLDQVYFAQTHVWTPDNPLFLLIGNRDALIKVNVYSSIKRQSPRVSARISLAGKSLELQLKGPAALPLPPSVEAGYVHHSLDDSFTALVPREWVHPGVKVTVEMRDAVSGNKSGRLLDSVTFDRLNVGAPHALIMCMFDVNFFAEVKREYPSGWIDELENKLPIASLEVRRAPAVVFDKIVMVPRAGKPAVLCGSRKEYETKTGIKFDGEQDLAGTWIGALKTASGQNGAPQRLFYLNIFGVPGGGEAGGFTGVGQGGQQGLLLHELGHALGLPHWGAVKDYPYRGNILGKLTKSGDDSAVHVGPTWAYDSTKNLLISPLTSAGRWKVDPMQGGGTGDQEAPFLYNHFSDYSIHRISETLNRMISYDQKAKSYVRWNVESRSYSPVPGKTTPIAINVDVVAILAAASGVTPEANIVYPPIGPHKSDLLDLYDAASPADCVRAKAAGYSETTCNVCLRVTQSGKSRVYLLRSKIDAGESPLDPKSLKTSAINVPASGGEVTRVDLLHIPDVMIKGLTSTSKILYSWSRAE